MRAHSSSGDEGEQRSFENAVAAVTPAGACAKKLRDSLHGQKITPARRQLLETLDELESSRQDFPSDLQQVVVDELNKAAKEQLPQVNFDHAVEAVEDATSAASGPASGSQQQAPPDAQALAGMSPSLQKQRLGECLHPLIMELQPELACRITGMIRETPNHEILTLFGSEQALRTRVDDALNILQSPPVAEQAPTQEIAQGEAPQPLASADVVEPYEGSRRLRQRFNGAVNILQSPPVAEQAPTQASADVVELYTGSRSLVHVLNTEMPGRNRLRHHALPPNSAGLCQRTAQMEKRF